jgi:tRNA dimethylallyltransferase
MSTDESLVREGDLPPVALIAGPTASGKSDLAVRLALALAARGRKAVVINADSAQVYADLAVLSARPSPAEMQGMPHRLYGAWDGARACSAADWAEAARREIATAHDADAVPILVGGTGLYLRTLIDGIAPVPPIDPAVREAVRALPVAEAHAALALEDPDRAALLHPSDTTRVARALEVVRSTGRPLAHWQAERSGGIGAAVTLHPAILLPDRQWLYERCDRRFAQMLTGGAIEEVQTLLARGLDLDLPVMRAIGVPEVAEFLGGRASLAMAQERGAQATRNYVKRQLTWLRHQCPPGWPRIESQPFGPADLFDILLRR